MTVICRYITFHSDQTSGGNDVTVSMWRNDDVTDISTRLLCYYNTMSVLAGIIVTSFVLPFHKQLETLRCVLRTVASDALALKHMAICIHLYPSIQLFYDILR